ncbi:MAG TPA: SusD/RagB family nutrient-binding outer membrane lipoprotein [Longimicrobiaceae bacterium]|nr:SusD/RagB family nutrient-binding outer membrane lipoprotein [Longimicrobiaceae bacterium]
MMHKWTRSALAVAALTGTLSACNDYLTGPGISDNPNSPLNVGTAQLYQGIQLTQFVQHTGDLSRHTSMWTQQMAGIGNQYSGRDQYVVTEQDLAAWYNAIYTGGGLIDIREALSRTDAAGDRTFSGMLRVWEAYLMGESASLWGALPYSEAVKEEIATPKLDDQAEVYRAVQAVLDQAIADLQSGQGAGPGQVDLVHRGDRTRWLQAAQTLKARFYMHWVEAQNFTGTHNGKNVQAEANKACGGNCVQKALAAAQNGISTSANNFTSFQSTTAGGENLWYQFIYVFRQGQMVAGRHLVELMRTRNDPRLTQYFTPLASGQVVGAPPGGLGSTTGSLLGPRRGAPDFRQPMLTYAENQLIMAEANYRLGNTAAALTNLNNARTSEGLTAVSGLTGDALFREIMTEKYIALFQNIEAYNDYKRTCIPAVAPVGAAQAVIGRILYSDTERAANPNIPAPTNQPARNDNDPQACPRS